MIEGEERCRAKFLSLLRITFNEGVQNNLKVSEPKIQSSL